MTSLLLTKKKKKPFNCLIVWEKQTQVFDTFASAPPTLFFSLSSLPFRCICYPFQIHFMLIRSSLLPHLPGSFSLITFYSTWNSPFSSPGGSYSNLREGMYIPKLLWVSK